LSLPLVVVAARAAAAKTLEDTVVLDVGDLIAITDHFVITGGRNDRQVRAVVEEVERAVKAAGGALRRSEGLHDAHWVLLDYGDFIVHVLDAEARAYYSLERLWSDSARIDWQAEEGDGALSAQGVRR
jgi:ribosome-associated protein